jgi:Fe-Mn family superoxide dismutase
MSPNPVLEPTENVEKLINDSFGSVGNFKQEFTDKASKLFGSGWVWLVREEGSLEIVETSGHDVPISETRKPIMVIDVWEHAYYLKYKNRRTDFIENWWNLLDWTKVKFSLNE